MDRFGSQYYVGSKDHLAQVKHFYDNVTSEKMSEIKRKRSISLKKTIARKMIEDPNYKRKINQKIADARFKNL